MTAVQKPVTAETPFAIASLSKAFTATAVLQLVDSGLIELDASVMSYIPKLKINDPRAKAITVRQLLYQTSGLSDKGFSEFLSDSQPDSLLEAVLRMETAHLTSIPGQKFHYHNPNYQILALLVESVSHERFSDYLHRHIFDPLGMRDTYDFSNTSAFYSGPKMLGQGHIFFVGRTIPMKEPAWSVDGPAGMISTANDMARWIGMQANGGNFQGVELLSSKSLRMMRKPPPEIKTSYGMGWVVSPGSHLYHSGILWTYSSEEIVFTSNGYGVVLLFNGGINAFVDYYSFVEGISDILDRREPEIPSTPYWLYPICAGLILLVAIGLSVRRLFRTNQWYRNYRSRSIWKSWCYLCVRLLPFCLLIFIPQLIALLGDRVLSWYRIFLIAPDIISGLVIFGVLNLAIVVIRILFLVRHSG